MTVQTLDPLTDNRWSEFVARQPDASIFHTKQWLRALQQTYGYKPVAFTTSTGNQLSNGVVFCQVRSWLTGNRLVSLPFSDHCQPLATGQELRVILDALHQSRRRRRWKYVELRPLSDEPVLNTPTEYSNSETFGFHRIDLTPDLDVIYRRFHESCIRRKIKRADREALQYEAGRSEKLLQNFGHLLLLTRRRHKLPPQPAAWFRNLAHYLGEALNIHLISKDSRPVASILTLQYKKSVVYKYGCSDARYHNLGGTPLLFWNAIQQSKEAGFEDFDLGRSALEDPGLSAFKEHLGAAGSELRYYRTPAQPIAQQGAQSGNSWARRALARLPDPLLIGAGRVLYRHLG